MIFFSLIILVVLVIYIFSQRGSGENSPDQSEGAVYLKTAIHELSVILKNSPTKSVKELLEDYQKRLRELELGEKVESSELKLSGSKPLETNLETFWSHWYSNNSINLLLYIGAFLIVASASIFVGFQWEVLSGVIKASFLSLVGVGFLSFGIWFFNLPKIRNAGNTFIAIAALLIPVCGSAWYNFVFKDLGVAGGPVWLVTSLLALGVYIFLTYQYKNRFYTYISSLTSLSLTFSLINTFNLNSDFYILAGIFTSFVLLLSSFALKGRDKDTQDFAQVPLEVSAQVMMPSTLIYGLFVTTGQHKLDTFAAVASIFLAAGFYILSYLHSKKSWNIAAAQILSSLGVVLFFNWQKLDNSLLIYTLDICAFLYIYTAYLMKTLKLSKEQDISLAIGLIQLILVFIFSFTLGVEKFNHTILAIAPILAGAVIAYIKNNIRFLAVSSIFIAMAGYLFYTDILKLNSQMEGLGVGYFVIGLLFYLGIIYLKKKTGFRQVFGLSTGFFFFLSIIFTFHITSYLLIISLLISAVGAHSAWQFEQPAMIYLSNAFLAFSLLNGLRYYNIDTILHPFFFAAISYIFYATSVLIKKPFQASYRSCALVTSVATPIFFGFKSLFYPGGILERNAIMTSYAATALFGFDVFLRKVANFGYITSVLGIVSYLWQIKYSGVTENLAYTLPLGVYFLILAYTRKIKEDMGGRQILDLLGLFFLLIPPLFLSFGSEAMKYSVTLGFVGIALLGVGITLSYKLYRYAGIAGIVFAVLPQTYSYILALPRWVAVGTVGLVFISVAIYLLVKRKEDE